MSWVLPVLLLGAAAWGLRKRVDVYDALVCGGREGLTVAAGLVPPLAALLTAVYMFRASGALELLTAAAGPVLEAVGIPRETAGLVLVRPLSGRGAGGGQRADGAVRHGELHRPVRGGDAGLHGDHVLHRGSVFRRGGHTADAVRHSGSAVRRRGGVFGGGVGGAVDDVKK